MAQVVVQKLEYVDPSGFFHYKNIPMEVKEYNELIAQLEDLRINIATEPSGSEEKSANKMLDDCLKVVDQYFKQKG